MSSRLLILLACLAAAAPGQGDETHWSLAPLERPAVPGAPDSASNPIDAFIGRSLSEHRLNFAPPADRRTWLRRVTVDLTGLLPTPEELHDFLHDQSANAAERVVDRLLSSPRYGERWARHWMDAVRYAETHGHDEDAIREHAWPYRDWLIRSFNEDLPYADFVRMQVAGDVLAPDDPWATAALGFLACGPWDSSSQMGIQDGTLDKKMAQYLDRDDMLSATMSTFTSTTVHCARCHDHKFDPVSLEDYYSLQAVFAGIDKVDRPFEPDPEVTRTRHQIETDLQELRAGTLPASRYQDPPVQTAVASWEAELQARSEAWTVWRPAEIHSEAGAPFQARPDGAILFGGTPPERDTYTLRGEWPGHTVTALQLEVLTDPSLPQHGPGRAPNGNLHLSRIEVRIGGKPITLARASADFNQAGWEIDKAIDDKPETAWGIHPEEGHPHRALFLLESPGRLEPGTGIEVILEQLHGGSHLIGCLRLSLTETAAPTLGEPLSGELTAILETPSAGRSEAQRHALARAWLEQDLQARLAGLPAPGSVFAVASRFTAMGNFKPAGEPREVHVLQRGDIRSPQQPAQPGALSCLPGLPGRFDLENSKDEGLRRAALADWLVHPDNVLAWRSIVNRVWHHHFGRGLVDTPNDLGVMGGTPSHPELLDWLAVTFRDGGGSLKDLHRRIVLSRTYRQDSADRGEGLRLDADNRLLWRMNRTRMEAEVIRDSVLQLSGKLDLTMGGPSARHFTTSKGVHVTPVVHYREFDPDHPANFRRSVYRFVFRTVPDPLMQTLDCPDASQLAPRRDTSTTALQALALLNNRFLVRQAEHLATRLQEAHPSLEAQVDELVLGTYGRPAETGERTALVTYAREHGLANACRVILNSSEFLYVR